MEIYFNEEAAWEPEDEKFVRGIPESYERLVEEAKSKEPVEVEGKGKGLVQSLVDGNMYGLLELREDPFEEYRLEIGDYERSEEAFLDINFVEQKHIQDRARVVRTGEEYFLTLLEIRTRLMSEQWDAKVIELEDVDMKDYMPFH